jgi:hypothetical protein
MRTSEVPAKQGGIALLQVLFLSVIMTLLLLQLTYSARGQLSLAREVEQRVNADLLMHSAKNEAVFALIVNSGTYEASSLSLVSLTGARANSSRVSATPSGFKVTTKLQDISGFLPLRFPMHPLWPDALRSLGMDAANTQRFLNEISDMQDQDAETKSFAKEVDRSSSGFAYPNAPIQMASDLGNWVDLDPEMQFAIEAFSHHYVLPTVNLFAAPDLIAVAALDEFGQRMRGQSINAEDRASLIRFVEAKYGLWVGIERSGLWRLDVEAVADPFKRRARFDLSLNPRGEVPFTIVGN